MRDKLSKITMPDEEAERKAKIQAAKDDGARVSKVYSDEFNLTTNFGNQPHRIP